MFPNVIDLEPYLHVRTLGTGVTRLDQDLVPETRPAHGAVPPPDGIVRPGVLEQDRMPGTPATGHEDRAAGLRADLHGTQH